MPTTQRIYGHGNLDCAQERCDDRAHDHQPGWTCGACCAAGTILRGHSLCQGCDCRETGAHAARKAHVDAT